MAFLYPVLCAKSAKKGNARGGGFALSGEMLFGESRLCSCRRMLGLALLLGAGCGTPMKESFKDEAYAPFAVAGDSAIAGTAFFTHGDRHATCNEAELIPSTPYMDEVVARLRADPTSSPWWDSEHGPNVDAAIRHGTCTGSAQFGFTNLPAGRWYVLTVVQAGPDHPPPCVPFYGSAHYGCKVHYRPSDYWSGWAFSTVETKPGAVTQVAVTEKDFSSTW